MSADEDLEKILQDQEEGIFHALIKNHLQRRPDHFYVLQNVANKFNKFITSPEFVATAQNITIKMNQLTKLFSNPEITKSFQLFLELPAKRRKMVMEMSEYGWFPFEECLRRLPLRNETLDDYMIGIIDNNFEDLKVKILEKYPERREIFECGFRLIEGGNDIAAIPLLLTQVDGISKDLFGMYFFTTSREPIRKTSLPVYLKNKGQEIGEDSYNLLKSIIDNANKTYISDGFEKLGEDVNSLTILNRSGILHGDRAFLKYCEKPNVYKVLSLLLYVDWMSELTEHVQ